MPTQHLRTQRGSCGMLSILVLASLAVTAGCAFKPNYTCDSGKALKVTFLDLQKKIRVDTGTGTFDLQSVPASVGTRYADEERVFWFKGDELSITVNDRPVYGQCRRIEGASDER
jgi:membrane-bound inhibitor of C-type lysozyme